MTYHSAAAAAAAAAAALATYFDTITKEQGEHIFKVKQNKEEKR